MIVIFQKILLTSMSKKEIKSKPKIHTACH